MSKTWIIIKREFMNSVSKKSFLILTILTPFLMAALVFVPLWMASIKDTDQKLVGVIDRTGNYFDLFTNDESYQFVPVLDIAPEMRTGDSDYEAILEIRDNLAEHPEAATIYSSKEISPDLTRIVNDVLGEQIRNDKLARYQIPELDRIIDDVGADFEVRTMKWDAEGNELISDTGLAMVAGMVFMFLIYMFVMSYGGMVMSSVVEEKTNRIVELMVSSVKPFDMMMGKILGVAAVAAVQVLIWGVLICGVSALAMPALIPSDIMQSVEAMQQGTLDMTQTDMDVDMLRAIGTATDFGYLASIFVWLLLFIIGGYLLYSAIFAAIGSSVDSVQDAQQLQTPVMMPIIFSIIIMMTILNDPNSTLAVWCSYIPFTSPVVMMARIPSGVPVWHIAVSLVILYATFVAAVWFAAKIYRVGIFMYGKKPSFKELWKWVRSKS